jgi:hypothetical protein
MIRVVQAAIRAASSGEKTWDYLRNERSWEGPMRSVFSRITPSISQDAESARCHAIVLLLMMGERYKAIWPDTKITFPVSYDGMYEAIGRQGWWQGSPPRLFGSSTGDAAEIAGVVQYSLAFFQQRGDYRNYSLLTKWLHFCFPETFAIYDGYASKSIQVILRHVDCGPNLSGFDMGKMGETSGNGYIGLLNSYRLFWEAAQTARLDKALDSVAKENEAMLRAEPGCLSARVSTLDILDKLLWKANGSAAALGLPR